MTEHAISGLTPAEERIMDHLVDAWNEFTGFIDVPRDDLDDFRFALHTMQRILAGRIVSRLYSDYWR